MPPKLLSDDKRNIVIRNRGKLFARESKLNALRNSDFRELFRPCHLCGSQENLQRQGHEVMLKSWDKQFPGRLKPYLPVCKMYAPSQLADMAII